MKKGMDNKFSELTEPEKFKKIIMAQKIPILPRGNFKNLKIKILKSYKDNRSYSLTAIYTIFLKNGAEIELVGTANSDGKKFYPYYVLRMAWEHFKKSKKRAIARPLIYFQKYGLFLREFVKGETLADDIKRTKKLRADCARQIIKWLKEFQKIRPQKGIKPAIDFYNIEKNLAILEKRRTALAKILKKEFKIIKKQIILYQKHFPKKLVHGDFNPLNIILTKNGLAVVDFEDAFVGDALFDIAGFCSHLLTLDELNLSRSNRLKTKKVFLKAYEKEFNKLTPAEKERFDIYLKYFNLLIKTHKLVWGFFKKEKAHSIFCE